MTSLFSFYLFNFHLTNFIRMYLLRKGSRMRSATISGSFNLKIKAYISFTTQLCLLFHVLFTSARCGTRWRLQRVRGAAAWLILFAPGPVCLAAAVRRSHPPSGCCLLLHCCWLFAARSKLVVRLQIPHTIVPRDFGAVCSSCTLCYFLRVVSLFFNHF